MQTAFDSARDRRLLRSLLLDFLLIIVLLIPVIVCEFGIEPFRRGFFCDDESIHYPFRPNTVTPVMLGLFVGLLPLLLIIIVEFVRFYRAGSREMQPLIAHWRVPAWLLECSLQIAYFCVGLLLTFDATEVGKYTIGRLRPHFMAVCQPQMTDGSTCADEANRGRYIENYICAIGKGFTIPDVRQGRLSFPSGHSSLAFYAMLYLALYLQRRLTWRGSRLTRHSLQFALLMLAWYTALSRVIDNWHHWSDVLVGSLIGVAGALLTAHYITKIFKVSSPMPSNSVDGRNLKLQLPLELQQNSAVQDVITTPPPYSLNSQLTFESLRSYSNEQYCTKV